MKVFAGVILTLILGSGLVFMSLIPLDSAPRVTDYNFYSKSKNDVHCSDFYKHEDAQKYFESSGKANLSQLDKDHDGQVCEGL